MSAIFANASSPKIGLSAGARLPTYRRMTFLAATSCSVQPAGRLAGAEGATDGAAEGAADTTADGATEGTGAGLGGVVAAPGVGGGPYDHCGAAAAVHAATVAARPASPATPATRRNPRRLYPEGASKGSDPSGKGPAVTGSAVMGSTVATLQAGVRAANPSAAGAE